MRDTNKKGYPLMIHFSTALSCRALRACCGSRFFELTRPDQVFCVSWCGWCCQLWSILCSLSVVGSWIRVIGRTLRGAHLRDTVARHWTLVRCLGRATALSLCMSFSAVHVGVCCSIAVLAVGLDRHYVKRCMSTPTSSYPNHVGWGIKHLSGETS